MVVITFRNRMAPGADLEEYGQRVAKLFDIVSAIPGFRSVREYAGEDRERVITRAAVDDHDVDIGPARVPEAAHALDRPVRALVVDHDREDPRARPACAGIAHVLIPMAAASWRPGHVSRAPMGTPAPRPCDLGTAS